MTPQVNDSSRTQKLEGFSNKEDDFSSLFKCTHLVIFQVYCTFIVSLLVENCEIKEFQFNVRLRAGDLPESIGSLKSLKQNLYIKVFT